MKIVPRAGRPGALGEKSIPPPRSASAIRTIPLLLLLLAPAGCGEATTSHRVPRGGPEPVRAPAAADALTRPPRAIATH